jgi:NAD(P)-dependent dehydrogenase (short-subunit alcohol dehydrogenase family)
MNWQPGQQQRGKIMAKVLLVTGGSRGIGAATALLAAERGYDVAINYRADAAAADRVVSAIHALGRRAIAVQADVSKPDDVVRLFNTVDKELGPLSALVNSAGVGSNARVEDSDPAALAQLFNTNVIGLILASREAVRRLSTKHGGRGGVIVNVSSMAATIGGRPGASHYAASKAAVDAFTTGLAKEVAREGVRAVSVRPGFTHTDMTEAVSADPAAHAAIVSTIPFGRAGEAIEIARPIVWLLSDEASFVSGAHLDVSGGGFLVGAGSPFD